MPRTLVKGTLAAREAPMTAAAFAAAVGALPTLDGRPPLDRVEDGFYFTTPLVHEGVNGNRDIFTRAEMEAGYRSLIGTPVDYDHDMGVPAIVGQIYDAAFGSLPDGRALIRVAAYIHQRFYPDLVWKIRSGALRGTSMETLFAYGEQRYDGRVLHGLTFVGMGLTRLPADDEALIDSIAEHERAAARRRQIVARAVESAMRVLVCTRPVRAA